MNSSFWLGFIVGAVSFPVILFILDKMFTGEK